MSDKINKCLKRYHKNKLGFTLIELLAVIVILAVIALIATPIVMNIIDDVKKSSSIRSTENYIRAIDLNLASNYSSGIKIGDGIYSFDEIQADINGKHPSDGWIEIKDNKVTNYKLLIDNKIVEKNGVGPVTIDSLSPLSTVDLQYREFGLATTGDTYISKVGLSYDKNFTVYFYLKKDALKDYSNLNLSIYNFVEVNSTKNEFNATLNNYFNKEEYVFFAYNFEGPFSLLLGNIDLQLKGTKDGSEEILSEFEYTLYDYFDAVLAGDSITNKNRQILISLINFCAAYQNEINCSISLTDKRQYLNLLESNDQNTSNLTSKATKIINEIPILNSEIANNSSEELNAYFGNDTRNSNIDLPFSFNFYFKTNESVFSTSDNTTLQEFSKYGIVFFNDQLVKNVNSYDELNDHLSEADIVYGSLEGYGAGGNGSAPKNHIKLKINIEDLNKTFYFKQIYNNDGEYYYGVLRSVSYTSYMNNMLVRNIRPKTMTTILNFIAEVTSE